MRQNLPLPVWTIAAPIIAWLLYLLQPNTLGSIFTLLISFALISAVMATVHQAEVIAHRIGEPYGTLVLAIAMTIIKVSLIVSLMLSGGPDTATLARDTVFAAVMIILTGIIGICLLVGGARHNADLSEEVHAEPPTKNAALLSTFLLLCLAVIVLLAKTLSPTIEKTVVELGAPKSLVGIIVAFVILLPEVLLPCGLPAKTGCKPVLTLPWVLLLPA